MKLSIITDEISQQLDDVIAFCRHFGLPGVELRSVEGLGVFDWTPQLVNRLQAGLSAAGLQVCCLSLPFYKCAYQDATARQTHLDGLKRSLEIARTLGAGIVRGFCFWRNADQQLAPEALQAAFFDVVPLLRDYGVTMALESDPSVNGHTAAALAGYVRSIDSPQVRALWDGGNLLFTPDGEDPIRGYALLKPLICHVHIKDARLVDGQPEAVLVGSGRARIAEQLRLLAQDHYDGWISLETHYRLHAKLDEATLRLPGGGQFSAGAAEASAESMQALQTLLQQIN